LLVWQNIETEILMYVYSKPVNKQKNLKTN